MKKNYTSFEDIDLELEKLNLKRQIHSQEIKLNFNKTKSVLQPNAIVNELVISSKKIFSSSLQSILEFGLSFLIKQLLNKKRGN